MIVHQQWHLQKQCQKTIFFERIAAHQVRRGLPNYCFDFLQRFGAVIQLFTAFKAISIDVARIGLDEGNAVFKIGNLTEFENLHETSVTL